MLHLARTRYSGANHTHMSELLREREGIDITRGTLRRLLVSAGENSPRGRRPPKHRVTASTFLPDASIDFAGLTPSLTVDSALHRYDNL